jgi:hypothetical protein
MKLQQFKQLIREMVESELMDEKKEAKPRFTDKLGKFFVVCHVDSTKEDPMMALTISDFMSKIQDGSIKMDKIAGIFKDSKAARVLKNKIMADVKKHRAEIDEELNEYRRLKDEHAAKAASVRDRITKMKQAR